MQYQQLKQQLRHNNQSGASELAIETLSHLHELLQQTDTYSAAELESIVKELSWIRPSMHALANALKRWLDQVLTLPFNNDFRVNYLKQLADIRVSLLQASHHVVRHACQLIQPGHTILTHSRSSQILALFTALKQQKIDFQVVTTISAPGNEGFLVAEQLNQWQIPVTVITDAQMARIMPDIDINLTGCDSWLADHCFVNKSGTYLQALAAKDFHKPFWVLADSFKNSDEFSENAILETMAADELGCPAGEFIQPINQYFEIIPDRLISGRVDENGLHHYSPDCTPL